MPILQFFQAFQCSYTFPSHRPCFLISPKDFQSGSSQGSSQAKRKRKTTILVRQLLPNMSNYIFQQDGAPAHHAKVTQEWCKLNLQSFWQKGIWPGNSPDLNPIENLWAILKSRVDEMEMCTNIEMLEKTVKLAWSEISPEILDNLISSMPKRIQKCLELSGDYIGK